MYCGQSSLVKYLTGGREATAIRCRSWLCPDCAPQRQRQLVAEAMAGAPTTFLTVTIRRVEGELPDDAAKRLIDAWRRTRRKWMTLHKVKHLPFLAIVEATKNKWPHLHILLRNVWLDQRWLSAQMLDLINSPVVDIRRIDNPGRAAGYVAKYAGKAAHKFGTCKRYWRSKDYMLKKREARDMAVMDNKHTERDQQSVGQIVRTWTELHWSVRWISTTKAACTFDTS